MGEFLTSGLLVRGSAEKISLYSEKNKNVDAVTCKPRQSGQTIFWAETRVQSAASLQKVETVYSVNYDLLHKRFGHPSKDVLRKAQEHTKNFPKGITFPKENPVCRGCAEGKMPSKSYPQSESRTTEPFELIHSDLKELPVQSYHKYEYFMVFLDDNSSHGWITHLRKKSDAVKAAKDFIAYVKNQFGVTIKQWRFDEGGEFKKLSNTFEELGIVIEKSTPYAHQQNGRAERFIRTIMEKAQAMRFEAHLP